MIDTLLHKVLFIILIMCVLNICKHVFEIIRRLRQDTPEKYSISKRDRLLLGLSISYVFTEIVFFINT